MLKSQFLWGGFQKHYLTATHYIKPPPQSVNRGGFMKLLILGKYETRPPRNIAEIN